MDHVSIRQRIESVCTIECLSDGVRFDPSSITVTDIRHDQEYGAVRVKLKAYLGTARIDLQVDIGSGDAITPGPVRRDYPTLLDQPAPRVNTYPRETFIAEKLEAMVRLGPKNTRMKDFWDVAAIARHFEFDGALLCVAVAATFERRRTPLPESTPVALTARFYDDNGRLQLWKRFRARIQPVGPAPDDLRTAGRLIRDFLGPVFRAVSQGDSQPGHWTPTRGWSARASGRLEA